MLNRVIQCTKFAGNHVRLLALKFITAHAQGPTRSREVAGMFSDPDLSRSPDFRGSQTLFASALLSGLLAVSGCSAMRPGSHEAAPPPAPPAAAAMTDTSAAPEPQ